LTSVGAAKTECELCFGGRDRDCTFKCIQQTGWAGHLQIYENAQLTSLDALEGLTSVGGDLWITYNDQLASIDGLGSVTRVGGGKIVEIEMNDMLPDILSLQELQAYVTS